MKIMINFCVHSIRTYGQPKLKKPKELEGVALVFSVDYVPRKCRCQIFIHDDDVWVKHRDYFSSCFKMPMEDLGMPLEALLIKHFNVHKSKKRVYSDAWGSVVLRQEAWLHIKGLVTAMSSTGFYPSIVNQILRLQEQVHGFEAYALCCTEMERFWERVIMGVKDYVRGEVRV